MNLSDTAADLIRTDPALAHEIARQLSMTAGGLTERQADALAFIRSYAGKHGFTPSFSEIADALGLASKSRVHALVTALEERGFVERIPGRARSISLRAAA